MNIRLCSIILTELWDLYQGLILAWNRGIKSLLVEADSLCMTQLWENQDDTLNALSPLVKSIKALLAQNWQVFVHNIDRKTNIAADFLATLALSLPLGLRILPISPPGVKVWLRSDSLGTAFPRVVKLSFLLLGSLSYIYIYIHYIYFSTTKKSHQSLNSKQNEKKSELLAISFHNYIHLFALQVYVTQFLIIYIVLKYLHFYISFFFLFPFYLLRESTYFQPGLRVDRMIFK